MQSRTGTVTMTGGESRKANIQLLHLPELWQNSSLMDVLPSMSTPPVNDCLPPDEIILLLMIPHWPQSFSKFKLWNWIAVPQWRRFMCSAYLPCKIKHKSLLPRKLWALRRWQKESFLCLSEIISPFSGQLSQIFTVFCHVANSWDYNILIIYIFIFWDHNTFYLYC